MLHFPDLPRMLNLLGFWHHTSQNGFTVQIIFFLVNAVWLTILFIRSLRFVFRCFPSGSHGLLYNLATA